MPNQLSRRPLRSSALALLALISISLVGCDKATQSGSDLSQEELDRQMSNRQSQTEPSSTPSPQSPTPFPDFYGTGPGGK